MKRNITSILASLSLAAAMTSCAHSMNDATLKSALNQTAQMSSSSGLNTVTDADGAGIAWTLNEARSSSPASPSRTPRRRR